MKSNLSDKTLELMSKGEELSLKEYKRLKEEYALKLESDSLRQSFTENAVSWLNVFRRKAKLLKSNPE